MSKTLAEDLRDFIFNKEPFGNPSIKTANIETVSDASIRELFGKACKNYQEINLRLTGHATTPTISVLSNETGIALTTARGAEGQFQINSASAIFTANKTLVTASANGTAAKIISANNTNTSRITVYSFTDAGVATDNIVLDITIKIFE